MKLNYLISFSAPPLGFDQSVANKSLAALNYPFTLVRIDPIWD